MLTKYGESEQKKKKLHPDIIIRTSLVHMKMTSMN